jgi:hypothetical protein
MQQAPVEAGTEQDQGGDDRAHRAQPILPARAGTQRSPRLPLPAQTILAM